MRAVISISLAPELAAKLQDEAAARGLTFSEHARTLLMLGRTAQALVDLASGDQRPKAEPRP